MGVYQIAYEVIENDRIVMKTHHIEAPDFEKAALYAIEFGRQFKHPVKGVAFLFKIADRVQQQTPETIPDEQTQKGE